MEMINRYPAKTPYIVHQQTGMTLLELTVVLLILTTLATIALRSTSGLQDQARWEQTKSRYEDMKKSIIGDPHLMVNGQPDISGFVVDMGRLPDVLRELIQTGYCLSGGVVQPERRPSLCLFPDDWVWVDVPCSDNFSDNKDDCTTAGAVWLGSVARSDTKPRYGWNGPYLDVSISPDEQFAFSDGWGNQSADDNYGWAFGPNGDSMEIQSNGCAACDLAEYENDYPEDIEAIGQDEWQVRIDGGVTVSVQSLLSGSCDTETCSDPSILDEPTCAAVGTRVWEIPLGQSNCQASGKTWTIDSENICLVIHYRLTDANGETSIGRVISSDLSISNDYVQHNLLFNDFYFDTNNNSIRDAGEEMEINKIDRIPIGGVTFSVQKNCAVAVEDYYGMTASPVHVTFFPSRELPVINW